MNSNIAELKYGLNDKPPFFYMLFLGLQQIFVVAIYLALISFIAIAANLPSNVAQSAISICLFVMGVGTILQANNFGLIGSGFLMTNCPAVTYFAAAVMAAKLGGIHLVLGMTVFAGACEMLFALLAKRLKLLFPIVVTGLTFTGLGLSVGIMAFHHIMAGPKMGNHQEAAYFVFLITLATILGLSIWAKGLLKLVSLMVGLLVGCIVAYFTHLFSLVHLHSIAIAPYFALPDLSYWGFSFNWSLAPLFTVAAIAAGLRTFGCVMTSQEINNIKNKNTMAALRKGTFTDGLVVLISGLAGTYPVGLSPSAIGITKVSGATSRVIAYAVGFFCILFSFSPKIAAFWVSVPVTVVSAGLVVTSSIMLVGGLRLVMSKPLDLRNTFIIGISVILALTPFLFPAFYSQLPSIIQSISHSMLSMIAISAIVLNIIFYPGKKKKVVVSVDNKILSEQELFALAENIGVDNYFIEQANQPLHALLGMIIKQRVNETPIDLALTHDEVNFDINISYQGVFPQLNSKENFKADNLFEDQVYIMGLSSLFKDAMHDDLSLSQKNNACRLRLRFSV